MADAFGPMTPGAPILSRRRVLVAGGLGQLGRWLARRPVGDLVEVCILGREHSVTGGPGMDLSDRASIEHALDVVRPQVVINAAAFTAVDAAEEDEAAAAAINVDGAARLAVECAKRGIPLVHVSTDYVPGLYGPVEDPAEASPLPATVPEDIDLGAEAAVYARTKWEGELAVRRVHPGAAVVRTAWVYSGPARSTLEGLGGGDFVTTMLRLESERETVNVVDDQWGNPTFARDLAEGLLRLANRLASGDRALEGAVLNAAGGGRATWYDLAAEAFALAGADHGRVLPVGTDEFPRPAARPSFSVLGDEEWRRAGLMPLPHWRDGLRRAFMMAR